MPVHRSSFSFTKYCYNYPFITYDNPHNALSLTHTCMYILLCHNNELIVFVLLCTAMDDFLTLITTLKHLYNNETTIH